ncbi:MAG: hypothetical protein K2P00_00070, partial [Alistipes sp.]|nr:hypothetical protein [Alistipes sp.]
IDGVEYPGVRRWHCEGGRYSEQYGYNGHFYSSHKKMIERILEFAESTPEKRPAISLLSPKQPLYRLFFNFR